MHLKKNEAQCAASLREQETAFLFATLEVGALRQSLTQTQTALARLQEEKKEKTSFPPPRIFRSDNGSQFPRGNDASQFTKDKEWKSVEISREQESQEYQKKIKALELAQNKLQNEIQNKEAELTKSQTVIAQLKNEIQQLRQSRKDEEALRAQQILQLQDQQKLDRAQWQRDGMQQQQQKEAALQKEWESRAADQTQTHKIELDRLTQELQQSGEKVVAKERELQELQAYRLRWSDSQAQNQQQKAMLDQKTQELLQAQKENARKQQEFKSCEAQIFQLQDQQKLDRAQWMQQQQQKEAALQKSWESRAVNQTQTHKLELDRLTQELQQSRDKMVAKERELQDYRLRWSDSQSQNQQQKAILDQKTQELLQAQKENARKQQEFKVCEEGVQKAYELLQAESKEVDRLKSELTELEKKPVQVLVESENLERNYIPLDEYEAKNQAFITKLESEAKQSRAEMDRLQQKNQELIAKSEQDVQKAKEAALTVYERKVGPYFEKMQLSLDTCKEQSQCRLEVMEFKNTFLWKLRVLVSTGWILAEFFDLVLPTAIQQARFLPNNDTWAAAFIDALDWSYQRLLWSAFRDQMDRLRSKLSRNKTRKKVRSENKQEKLDCFDLLDATPWAASLWQEEAQTFLQKIQQTIQMVINTEKKKDTSFENWLRTWIQPDFPVRVQRISVDVSTTYGKENASWMDQLFAFYQKPESRSCDSRARVLLQPLRPLSLAPAASDVNVTKEEPILSDEEMQKILENDIKANEQQINQKVQQAVESTNNSLKIDFEKEKAIDSRAFSFFEAEVRRISQGLLFFQVPTYEDRLAEVSSQANFAAFSKALYDFGAQFSAKNIFGSQNQKGVRAPFRWSPLWQVLLQQLEQWETRELEPSLSRLAGSASNQNQKKRHPFVVSVPF